MSEQLFVAFSLYVLPELNKGTGREKVVRSLRSRRSFRLANHRLFKFSLLPGARRAMRGARLLIASSGLTPLYSNLHQRFRFSAQVRFQQLASAQPCDCQSNTSNERSCLQTTDMTSLLYKYSRLGPSDRGLRYRSAGSGASGALNSLHVRRCLTFG
jgi:hypothetical protein